MAATLKHRISNTGILQTTTYFSEILLNQDGYWSNYFNRSTDYFTISASNAFLFSALDFTVEAWIYLGTSGVARGIVNNWQIGGAFIFRVTATNVLNFSYTTAPTGIVTETYTGTTTIPTNAWTHVAVVRVGNFLSFYINGTLDSSGSKDITGKTIYYYNGSTKALKIGIDADTVGPLSGYISNLRIVKGTGVYTSNFTPSTAPLTAVANTSLLTCQSSTFKDNSPNNFTITATGNPTVSNFIPFNITYSKFANNVILGTLDEVTNPGPPMRVSNNSSILVKSYFDEINISLSVQYLVIGGGGGGGGHGGGGAGGFRTGYLTSLNVGTNYTVTVGAGGAGATSRSIRGANGNNSVFSAITSTAGGGGGSAGSSGVSSGLAGGSGGGGANFGGGFPGGSGNIPFVVPPQGTNGGAGAEAYAGGGGGGAGNAGQDGQGNTLPGNGGQGAASSISGNTVVYCGGGGGGGGGGGTSIGSGGSFPSTVGGSKGGAGDGSYQSGVAGGAGTTNTGGGGGGGGRASAGDSNSVGGNGGSGIIILKYPDIYSLSNPGGGLSFSTTSSNGYSITTFTSGTGNIQWSQ
jgi:hypothetical protein